MLGIITADSYRISVIVSVLGVLLLWQCWRPMAWLWPIVFFCLGLAWAQQYFLEPNTHLNLTKQPQSFLLRIQEPLTFLERGFRVRADYLEPDENGFKASAVSLRVYQGDLPLRSGDLVRIWGRYRQTHRLHNFGQPDRQRQQERLGLHGQIQVDTVQAVVSVGQATGWWWWRPAEAWRYTLRQLWSDPGPVDGLLRALVLGDRSGLGAELQEKFQRAGLSHMLAISGQHIGLVALLAFMVFRWVLRLCPPIALYIPLSTLAWSLAWLPTTAYVGLAGAPVTAVRAWIFLSAFILALWCLRQRDTWTIFCVAAALILLYQPAALFSLSFQLSFMAIASLLWVSRWTWLQGRRLVGLLVHSLAIILWTAPLLAYTFQQLSFVGVISHVLASVYFAVILCPLILLRIISLIVSASVIVWPQQLLDLALTGFIKGVHFFSTWPGQVSLSLSVTEVLFIYGALLLLLLSWQLQRRRVLCLTAFASFVLLSGSLFYPKPLKHFRMTLLDVGQGDAIVLQFPDGKNYLVDGGGHYIPSQQRKFPVRDVGASVVVPALRKLGVKALSGVILSHPHPDHYGGLLAVVKNFPVKNFYWNGDRFPDEEFQQLLQQLNQQHTSIVNVMEVPSDITGSGYHINWLKSEALPETDLNNRSLGVRIDYGATCVLLTGDMEAAAERFLVRAIDGTHLRCDILKVPHHGSRTSSTAEFLDAVQPQLAIVSVGARNRFGLPHASVVESYGQRNIPLYRTDQHGAVQLESDGKQYWVRTAR